jgi:hypothetical protein
MKLHILRKSQSLVGGFTPLFLDDGLSLGEFSDNECEFILAPDIMDNFDASTSQDLLAALTKKLRLGGTLVVGGTHIRLFAKAVLNGLVSSQEASAMVGQVRSMTYSNDIVEILRGFGLVIESSTMDGVHYEIRATRKNQNA